MGVMNAILFDKLAYVEALQGSGISKKEATAHASALDTAMREGVATSADLVDIRGEIADVRAEVSDVRNELKAEIAEVKNEIKADIADVRHELQMLGRDLTIRLGGMLVTGIAVVAALVKLL